MTNINRINPILLFLSLSLPVSYAKSRPAFYRVNTP